MGDWNVVKQPLHVESDAGYAGNVTIKVQHIREFFRSYANKRHNPMKSQGTIHVCWLPRCVP